MLRFSDRRNLDPCERGSSKMSDLNKMMRQKRFDLKDTQKVRLLIESSTGGKYEVNIQNCSLTGMAGTIAGALAPNDGLDFGALVPVCKLCVEGQEMSLGRLVVRRVSPGETGTQIAFSTIDIRVPVDGMLSKYI